MPPRFEEHATDNVGGSELHEQSFNDREGQNRAGQVAVSPANKRGASVGGWPQQAMR